MHYPPFKQLIEFSMNDLLRFLDLNDAHPLVLAHLVGLGHRDECSARQWANLGRVLAMPENADLSYTVLSAIVLGILGDDAGRRFMEFRERQRG